MLSYRQQEHYEAFQCIPGGYALATNNEYSFVNVIFKFTVEFPRGQWVKFLHGWLRLPKYNKGLASEMPLYKPNLDKVSS